MTTLKKLIEENEKGENTVDIKLTINGKEVPLVPDGDSKQFDRFKEPTGLPGGCGDGKSPLMAKVYIKKGWLPE